MDSQENEHLRKTKGGFAEKRPHFPKMLWMKNRLQKNKSSSSSDLMDRVQTFLKQIAESNCQLEEAAAKNPGAFNIENIDDSEDNVIEMDLAVVPVGGESDTEESSDEEEYEGDDSGSAVMAGKLRTERKTRTAQFIQVLSGDNQEKVDDDDLEDANDGILCHQSKPEDDQRGSSDSSNSDSFVITGSGVKAKQKRGRPLVEIISGHTDEGECTDTVDTVQEGKQESDDSSDHYSSDIDVDKFVSIQKKKRSGPLIEVLKPEDSTH